MPKKSDWPRGSLLHTTKITIPQKTWKAARIRSFQEDRAFQELVAEALEDYLRTAKKTGDRR
jgi:hypothetical protein